MITLKIATNLERKEITVEAKESINDIFDFEGGAVTVYLNGNLVTNTEASFADLGVEDGSRALLCIVEPVVSRVPVYTTPEKVTILKRLYNKFMSLFSCKISLKRA